MIDFKHMNAHEVWSHIDKFGTDEQKAIANALYEYQEEIDWELCPNCDDAERSLSGIRLRVEEAVRILDDEP